MAKQKNEQEEIVEPVGPPKILVVGSGVAGVKCAFSLADLGYKVILQDRQPYLGGKISKLYKQFPTNDCGWCKMLPQVPRGDCSETCLRRNIIHKNIALMPYSTILSAKSEKEGGFEVRVHRKTRYIDEKKCTGCGLCVNECPAEVADSYNEGQTKRKAIWMRNGGPVPRVVTVDIEHCINCGKCVQVCPTKAVNLEMKDTEEDLKVSAVVLATGYSEAQPELSEYGYGKYPNVLTNMELERLIGGDGIGTVNLSGKNVGIIQCVGSRTETNDYCSYACCMYALKEAMMLKKTFPDCKLTIYYMDMRTFGRDYYRYQKEAEAMGIRLVQCRVPAVDKGEAGRVTVKWTDEADIHSEELDYVVLSVGQKISEETKKLIATLGVKHDNYGFIETCAAKPVHTSVPGIYACGSATGPKDIPDSVTEALAVAGQISMDYPITEDSVPIAPPVEKPELRDENEPRLALFMCACGIPKKTADAVFDVIIEKARKRKGVAVAEKFDLLCQPEQAAKLKALIIDNKVTRVLFAACSPYQYQDEFEEIAAQAGVDLQMVDIADIREQGFWTGADAKGIERKVFSQISKLLSRERIESKPAEIVKRALVIGGGAAGLNAALLLAKHGIEVIVVEKDKEIGGNLNKIGHTIEGDEVHKIKTDIVHRLKSEPSAKILCESEVTAISGHMGEFTAEIRGKDSHILEKFGSIIIASGGSEYHPTEFGYGKDKRIMTQLEFEHPKKKVVMIQCVGSRDEKHPYCSRVCCNAAIKNALITKKQNPDADVYIMHRDIMTYGLYEKYYTEARKAGINFIRFTYEEQPQVTIGSEITVTVKDRVIGKIVEVKPDAVVLSAGIVPTVPKPVVDGLKLETTPDGFIKEANAKFRPVDTMRDGVFVCGLAHSPRSIPETLIQSGAAAVQALNVLSGKVVPRRVISEVSERWCIACEMCVAACPYGAREMDREKNVARVIEPLCRGCGVCAVVCPSESSRLVGYRRKGMMDVIDEILEV